MTKSFADVMAEARREVCVLPLDVLAMRLREAPAFMLVDVREGEEYRAGHIPGAVNVPRGFLEARIESVAPSRDTHVVLYCAGGSRALLAARTLREMGYTRVESVHPGFSHWKEQGHPVVVPRVLTEAQRARYARHVLLPEVGEHGQRALLDARVLLVGVGGLGSPVALYLTAAGVGTLGLVDADVVDVSNLQRQVIHGTAGVGRPKVDSAEEAIRALNPDVRVVKYTERLTSATVDRVFDGYDLVVDGSDNFPTRYLVNDAAVMKRLPVVHGSVFRFEGQVSTFVPFEGPCYRCVYPEPPPMHLAPSCQEAGVLGVLPGVIGLLQATEAIKLILRQGDLLVGRMIQYDALTMTFREFRLRRDKGCAVCGEAPSITRCVDYEERCRP
jgi:molybdopterin/thiamine biosynthesis adenylyltransferase/rhodanese-related sulfurtransferase